MQLFRKKAPADQLDLLDANRGEASQTIAASDVGQASAPPSLPEPATTATFVANGLPLFVPIASIDEDPSNPRTEFLEVELAELADDIRQHGILQPIVVHAADSDGRYRIHFGAKRWRAAQRAGLAEVPIVIRDASADPYAQVAENQKRHGLTPLDLAKFIKARTELGDSNAFIAKRLGMNLTTVAHCLSLLDLPPVLDEALKTGRCTSPRTLHELRKLHEEQPKQVQALMAGKTEITRSAVSALRVEGETSMPKTGKAMTNNKLIAQANSACDRLERSLGRIPPSSYYKVALPDLVALRIRVEDITKHWLQGSDRQTP